MTDFFQKLIEEFQLPLQNPVLAFSLILIIILLSPILLKRLNIPGIIGLIISGVIIGPHGLNILAHGSAVNWFSTIGLLYIMFIAGLELDLGEFKANKNKSLSFGLFTFIIPLAIGYPVVRYGLGYDFNAAFLTASMFATHTLVTYPIVSNMGVSKNQAVAITVGGTMLTDTAVLIILSIIVANSQGGLGASFWLRMGISLAIFIAIIFFIIPKIARWFFEKYESEKHSHYIFVLSVVFFASFLAEVAGVENIIGAFAAGLALNSLIPHSGALMNRIEFIGNSLFIPFFLISVGMLVDVRVIVSGPAAWIVAGALLAVAIGGKWIAAWVTQHAFKYSSGQRGLIFGLSGAHAAATLAVILVGFNNGILDENILNGTILVILVASIIASLVTEKAARTIKAEEKAREQELEASKDKSDSGEHILIPISKAENIGELLKYAVLIKKGNSENPISVLSVVPNNEEAEIKIGKIRDRLEDVVKEGSATETEVNVITAIENDVATGISRVSKEIVADVIVMMWPQKTPSSEKLNEIVDKVDRNIFLCEFRKPLELHDRVILFVPPNADMEKGFDLWYRKIAQLTKELSAPLVIYGEQNTMETIELLHKKSKFTTSLELRNFDNWEDFPVLASEIHDDDLVILASSRKKGLSYRAELGVIPDLLQKHFSEISKIILFPIQDMPKAHEATPVDQKEAVSTKRSWWNIGKGMWRLLRDRGKD